ncbi:MAG: hydroxymyristoyl-ACP dehydratase [Zavarzinella sp.]
MKFHLIDRIIAWEAGKRLRAVKNLTLAEEYLADHFPSFPVMPGVMMLQSVVEASSWLWRISSGFSHDLIVLKEAKNVKYGTFMLPGNTMQIQTDLLEINENTAVFRGKGTTEAGATTVSAQIVLRGEVLPARDGPAPRESYRHHWLELTRFVKEFSSELSS